jgi:hypothetical protein
MPLARAYERFLDAKKASQTTGNNEWWLEEGHAITKTFVVPAFHARRGASSSEKVNRSTVCRRRAVLAEPRMWYYRECVRVHRELDSAFMLLDSEEPEEAEGCEDADEDEDEAATGDSAQADASGPVGSGSDGSNAASERAPADGTNEVADALVGNQ